MANRYERVATLSGSTSVADAPVLIEAGALLHDAKTDALVCQLKLKNMSDKTVSSASVCIKLGEDGGDAREINHVYAAVFVSPGEEFGQDVAFDAGELGPTSFFAECTSVVFADGDVWSPSPEEETKEISRASADEDVEDLPMAESRENSEQSDNPKTADVGRPAEQPAKKKRLFIIAGVAIALILLIVLVPKGTSSKWPNTIHVPELAEVEDKLGSFGGPDVTFEEPESKLSDYEFYDLMVDGKETGSLYFNAGPSEDVGLYVDDEVDDWKQVFERTAHAVCASVDPSLDSADAGKWIDTALSSKRDKDMTYTENGVTYKFKVVFNGSRLILRVVVPDDIEETAASPNKSSTSAETSSRADSDSRADSSRSRSSSSSGSSWKTSSVPSINDFERAASSLKLSYTFRDADDGDYSIYSDSTLIGMVKLDDDSGVTVIVNAQGSDSETWMAGMMMTVVGACDPSLGVKDIQERATNLLDASSLEVDGLSYSIGTAGSDYYFITVRYD